MNDFDRKIIDAAQKDKIVAPDIVRKTIESTLSDLPETQVCEKRHICFWKPVLRAAVCFAVAIFMLLPNISTAYAQAMEKIPVIGDIIRVFTIRNYFYSDQYHEMDIDVPEISDIPGSSAADQINQDVEKFTDQLKDQFYADLEADGNESHSSIKVDYEVVTNNSNWFTLKVAVHYIAGSGSTEYRFYHIDRHTGKIMKLGDLFKNEGYQAAISEDIRAQMRKQMEEDSSKVYWVDNKNTYGADFVEINSESHFYFSADGRLVIPFDKYDVAPGSMGCPEFTIEKSVYADFLKDEYKNMGEE